MHAIAWHIKQRNPEKNIVYLSAEKFMYKFVRALRYKDTAAFKEQFRSVDVLMVDDVQFMGGKDNTQEEFFYTFNSLIEEGRQIIISADKSPSACRWPFPGQSSASYPNSIPCIYNRSPW